MTRKRVLLLVIGAFVAFFVANIIHPNHHPHFAWDKIPGFYGFFAIGAGLALIGVALGLGNLFLWRPTWSVQLDESLVREGTTVAVLKAYHVALKDPVKKGDALLVLSTPEGDVMVYAPLDGVVQKLFYHPGDSVDVGWTLVDLKVSAHVMHHGPVSAVGEQVSTRETDRAAEGAK